MNDLTPTAQHAISEFQACKTWEQRARVLLQWGAQLDELPEALRTQEHLVQGCETQVWLFLQQQSESPRFQVASEARLLRGLLALLLLRIEGLSAEQIAQVDVQDWFNQLGLSRQLSPSRSNGLNAVLLKMRELLAH